MTLIHNVLERPNAVVPAVEVSDFPNQCGVWAGFVLSPSSRLDGIVIVAPLGTVPEQVIFSDTFRASGLGVAFCGKAT